VNIRNLDTNCLIENLHEFSYGSVDDHVSSV